MTAEFGQLLHNNPIGVEIPDFAEALCFAIRREIARVYWNTHQKEWRGSENCRIWSESEEDPGIPGIEWREYYNWGGSPNDADWDQRKADASNFAFEGVEIRWYKLFGRSMNANVDWSPEKWAKWFDRCLATVRAYERANSQFWSGESKYEYPDPAHRVPLDG